MPELQPSPDEEKGHCYEDLQKGQLEDSHAPEHEQRKLQRKQRFRHALRNSACVILCCLVVNQLFAAFPLATSWLKHKHDEAVQPVCPVQHLVVPPASESLDRAYEELASQDFIGKSLERWQKAIQVETQSFDDQGTVKNDPEHYAHLAAFDKMLRKQYPLLFDSLDLEMVNTYGYFFTWKGTDETLKPACYMAHYDTVPFGDPEAWTHPPLSGYYDGKLVWGRGSLDDKSMFMAIMDSVTALLESGFQPDRTILLSFGFDEELMKHEPEGSRPLAQRILEIYGPKGVESVIDEGGLGIRAFPGGEHLYASPAVTEKGYLDVKITVKSQGGHSSVPPEHTGIGIMAALITALESHPHEPAINAEHPLLQWAFCLLDDEAASPHLKAMIKQAARSSSHRQKLANYLTHAYPAFKPLLSTTQASDVIRGGIKANALPEETTLIVNHRIGLHSSIKELQKHLVQVLEPVAASFGVPFDAFDGKSQRDCAGICVEALNDLEPAPVSSLDSPSWEKFAGTIRHVFGENITVAPSVSTGNTDTKEYHEVTDNIYRFTPFTEDSGAGLHSIDERSTLENHIDIVKFYFQLLRNMNGPPGKGSSGCGCGRGCQGH